MTTPLSKPTHLTLATLPDLMAYHRAKWGGLRMEATGTDTGSETGEQTGTQPSGDGSETAGQTGEQTPSGGEAGKTFTQADLDAFLKKRLGEEKAKYEQQIKDLTENAGKTELEKLTAERDRYKEQVDNVGKTSALGLAKAEAKVAALTAKARPDRLAAVIAQADLDDALSEDGTVDEAKVKAAVEKVLADFPEWKANPGSSGTELNPGAGEKKQTFTRQQIKDMSPEERARRVDELNAAMAEGRIVG